MAVKNPRIPAKTRAPCIERGDMDACVEEAALVTL